MQYDLGGGPADRLAAERDQFVGAMKFEHADLADLQLHQRVGRITREPRAHDAVLENLEGVDHHGHEARGRGVGLGGNSRGAAAPPAGDHAAAAVVRQLVDDRRRLRTSERILDGRAAPDDFAGNVECDNPFGAERAGDADRNRIDDRPVEKPAALDLDRFEHARQRIRGPDRLGKRAASEPDLVPAADLGRDARETDRQILDPHSAELRLKLRPQPLAAEEAPAGERKVEEAEHAAFGQRTGEGLQDVEFARGVAAAERANRSKSRRSPRASRPTRPAPAARRYAPSPAPRPRRARRRGLAARCVRRRASGSIASPVRRSEHCNP